MLTAGSLGRAGFVEFNLSERTVPSVDTEISPSQTSQPRSAATQLTAEHEVSLGRVEVQHKPRRKVQEIEVYRVRL